MNESARALLVHAAAENDFTDKGIVEVCSTRRARALVATRPVQGRLSVHQIPRFRFVEPVERLFDKPAPGHFKSNFRIVLLSLEVRCYAL